MRASVPLTVRAPRLGVCVRAAACAHSLAWRRTGTLPVQTCKLPGRSRQAWSRHACTSRLETYRHPAPRIASTACGGSLRQIPRSNSLCSGLFNSLYSGLYSGLNSSLYSSFHSSLHSSLYNGLYSGIYISLYSGLYSPRSRGLYSPEAVQAAEMCALLCQHVLASLRDQECGWSSCRMELMSDGSRKATNLAGLRLCPYVLAFLRDGVPICMCACPACARAAAATVAAAAAAATHLSKVARRRARDPAAAATAERSGHGISAASGPLPPPAEAAAAAAEGGAKP
jgi:hypothetical protein